MKRRSSKFVARNPFAKPESLDSLLSSTLGSYRLKKKVQEYAFVPRWEEVVGEDIAKVAIPEGIIRGKILKVRVEDAVWAQELTLQKSIILEKLHLLGEGAVIEDIYFSTGSPTSFGREKIARKQ